MSLREPFMIYKGSYEDPEYYIGNTRTWETEESFIEACKMVDDSYEIFEDTIRKKWVRLVPIDEGKWMNIYDAKPEANGAFLAWHVDAELREDED